MTSSPQELNAYHEAGHAVAAVVLNTGLVSVDIRPQPIPGGGTGVGGANILEPPAQRILGKGEEAVMPYLVTFRAGWLAERIVHADAGVEVGHPLADGDRVLHYARGAICAPVFKDGGAVLTAQELKRHQGRIDALIEDAHKQTEALVRRYSKAIEALAATLLVRRNVDLAEVRRIVAKHPRSE